MRRFLKKLSSTDGSKRFQDGKTDRPHVAVIPVSSPEAPDEDILYIPTRATLEGLPVEISPQFYLLSPTLPP